MSEPLTGLLQQLGIANMLVFVAALARVTPLFIFAPLFSSRQLPPQVRAVVAVALAIGLTPAADPGRAIDSGSFAVMQLLAIELLVGAALAFAMNCLMAALDVAGALLDFVVGFAFGATIDPISGNQSAVIARLYSLFGVIIFVTIGGDEWVIRGLARTYELVPLGSAPDVPLLVGGALEAFTAIFAAAIQVGAPIILALVLTDVGFGLVTRVVPQLNVFAVGLPVKVLVGMLLIGITLPLVGGWLRDEIEQSVGTALRTLRVG